MTSAHSKKRVPFVRAETARKMGLSGKSKAVSPLAVSPSRVELNIGREQQKPFQSQVKPAVTSAALTSERVRQRMVERLQENGIKDARVLSAIGAIPRHLFVDEALAAQAYQEIALTIGHGQTISKPFVVARMLELALAAQRSDKTSLKVLEIGTGCGYQAAVLSQLAQEVYSIERVKPLFERAKINLRPLRIPNLRLHYGDGRLGLECAAPFDAIIVAAAGLEIPHTLLAQLKIGGRCIAPVGSEEQVLTLTERVSETQWRESQLDSVFFVPLKFGVI